MSLQTNRRQFLKQGLSAGLGTAILPAIVSAKSPNGKLQHASIGIGGMGGADLARFSSNADLAIVAICDIDLARLAAAGKKFPGARRYQHWRELLETEGDKIDSVNVSTPDHMHAPIAMSAINRGKHAYCQKPLSHDVFEARQLAAAAAKADVVTQMGIQINASVGYRMAVKLIRDGAIGKVKRVYAWSCKPAGRYRPLGPRPSGEDPVPATFDWDAWLGTATERPHKLGVYYPSLWRGWQDFGAGWLGDMGCHIIDTPYQALRLGAPQSVTAEVDPAWRGSPARRAETWPVWQIVRYTFPGNELTAQSTLELTWSDGGKYPPEEVRQQIDGQGFPREGAVLLGEAGALLLPHVGGPQLFPAEKFKDYQRPEIAPRNHYGHWVDACRNQGKTAAGFDYAGPLTEVILLGTVALRCPDKEMAWDAEQMKITNVPEANQYIRRRYREGWTVAGL
ncbi:MAG: Gfo/Idh/MocA family oxidoreductase [Candidatus Nealsonbacteria bacterium]|nr:Gfo/Idh/MocA family oxidoreductase [Candidatus Nealsonbacteria bacterium]